MLGVCMEHAACHLPVHEDPPLGALLWCCNIANVDPTPHHAPSPPPPSSAAAATRMQPLPRAKSPRAFCSSSSSAAAAATLQKLPQHSLSLTTCPLHLLRLLQQLRRLAAGGAYCLPWPALHGCLSFLQCCVPLPADMLGPSTQSFQRNVEEIRPSGLCSSWWSTSADVVWQRQIEMLQRSTGADAGRSGSQGQGTIADPSSEPCNSAADCDWGVGREVLRLWE